MDSPSKRVLKPVRIMAQEGIGDLEKKAVMEGIYYVLQLTGAESKGLTYSYDWKAEDHLGVKDYKNADGSLKPHLSVKWYIEQGRIASERDGLLNSDMLLMKLKEIAPRDEIGISSRSWKKRKPYEILVVKEGIYTLKKGDFQRLDGQASPGKAAVISTAGSRRDSLDAEQYVRSVAMHEMGHVLGLIPDDRTEAVKLTSGTKHCTNECVMQSCTISTRWRTDLVGKVLGVEKKVIYDTFCPLCETYLDKTF